MQPKIYQPILRILMASCLGLAAVVPVAAWTPDSQLAISDWAAKIVPTDLREQINRHRTMYHQGAMAGFQDSTLADHEQNSDGSGDLQAVIEQQAARAVQMIESHQPFEDVVYQLGLVSHFVADADSPLNCDNRDPSEPRYYADFQRYAQSAEGRLTVVFYGIDPGLHDPASLSVFLTDTIRRTRSLYASVGEEYRRIGYQNGQTHFDDRSTAFGVVSVAYSQAVSDIAVVLRYIWIRAGGADRRPDLPIRSP